MCRVESEQGDASVDDVESAHSAHSPREVVVGQQQQDDSYHSRGSSLGGVVFNFTNCIIGAGAIGLGGAISMSGGAVSILCIVFFAIMTKLSLDLVIELSVETEGARNSYEELARIAYGQVGWLEVVLSKSLYSFGCLVAYIVVVKDNFASALVHLVCGSSSSDCWFGKLLSNDAVVTLWLSGGIILPLCLLRDMSSLSSLSAVSVASMVFIVLIVFFLYFDNPGGTTRETGNGVYKDWFEVRPGVLESLGTFVFTFVSQHTVHLAYESLRPDIRSIGTWKTVSSLSILIATTVSLSVGVVVYMTFWEQTQSDLFNMYPPLRAIDAAKLLLCVTMLLTFPLPFFTCRELIIVCVSSVVTTCGRGGSEGVEVSLLEELQEPLLEEHGSIDERESNSPLSETSDSRWLLPGHDRQLKLPYHVALTFVLWSMTTLLAILAPSLGDVLDLVGCATGTVIAFCLPALFSFRLKGYTHLGALILAVGGFVGLLGTFYSVKKLMMDLS